MPVGVQDRPRGHLQSDVGGLARAFHGGVVTADGDQETAKGMASERGRDAVAACADFDENVAQAGSPTSEKLAEPLVLGCLVGPLATSRLPELGSQVAVVVVALVHSFSRSRHPMVVPR